MLTIEFEVVPCQAQLQESQQTLVWPLFLQVPLKTAPNFRQSPLRLYVSAGNLHIHGEDTGVGTNPYPLDVLQKLSLM